MDCIENRLLEKSKEAFILSIEIYNKPTIRYRVEGFSLFICNAWELMLKAYMIKTHGNESIYFKDNPNRTKTLETCLKEIFTNKNTPLRLNLEKIIELRNLSTHFITEEYEMIYIPLFQACVYNYVNKMSEFHQIDVTEHISQNFLILSMSSKPFNNNEIKLKYPTEISEKLMRIQNEIASLSEMQNNNFAIQVNCNYFLEKNADKADIKVGIDNLASDKIKIVKEIRDPNNTHNFKTKKLIKEVTTRLQKNNIHMDFNQYHFQLFCKYFNMKNNDIFCYINTIGSTPDYSYSIHAIDFIVNEIMKDSENIYENLKKLLMKKEIG